jgi:pSer/pThr/pTyr-binding forkhead associated (FHA) protein
MQVTLFSGDDVVGQFALAPDEYMVVGSDSDTEIQLDDDSVSGKHARFYTYDEQLYVEDLGSANGTAVDGVNIEGGTLLRDDCSITFVSLRVSGWH